MRILVTRPEPDAQAQAETLAARGHEAVLAPLLIVEIVPNVALELDGAQAVIVTSRNALRALATHAEREQALQLPLFAVGEASAVKAIKLGFTDATAGTNTAQGLLPLIVSALDPQDGPLVHLSGETLAFDLKAALEAQGFEVSRKILYRALPARELPEVVLAHLREGRLDAAIFMSPRTARTFADLLGRDGAVTQGKRLVCYCLSQAVAESLAPLGFTVRVAESPREEDLLALLDADSASSPTAQD
jgi:uroporphyrinogen-III synthase